MARIPGKLSRIESDFRGRLALFVCFACVLLFCTYRHQPWRDEFQTFLVATRTKDWAEFWRATQYERTPPFHYLLQRELWPVVESFLDPRVFISAITLPFTFLSAFLIVFRFGFSLTVAVAILFNLYFFREWGVISRSYAIGAALMLAAQDFKRRDRRETGRFFLALSATTHVLFFFAAAGLLGLEYGKELLRFRIGEKPRISILNLAVIVALFGVVVLHAQVPEDAAFGTHLAWPGTIRVLNSVFINATIAFLPFEIPGITNFDWHWNLKMIRIGWAIPVGILFWFAFRRERDLLVTWAVGVIGPLLLFSLAVSPAYRHLGVVYAVFVYVLAEANLREKERSFPPRFERGARLALAGAGVLGTAIWLIAWNPIAPRFAFSDSVRIAPLLKSAGTIYATRTFSLFPAMAESGREVVDIGSGRICRYPEFKIGPAPRGLGEFCSDPKRPLFTPGDLIVVSEDAPGLGFPSVPPECGRFEKVYVTEGRVEVDETFAIYSFSGSVPAKE